MTALETAAGEAGSDEVLAPSTTALTLRRLRRGLVAGSLLVGVLCIAELAASHSVLQTIGRTGAPAVIQVREASDAFADAEQAALAAVRTGASELGGVGDQYDNDVALMDQSLTELGADNAAGADGLAQIKLVEATMVTYNNQVEQAYNDYEQGTGGLAYPDLSQATNLATTVQDELRGLTDQENKALTAQRSSDWLEAVADLPWLLAGLALLALFAVAFRLIRTRFRRRFSVALSLAAACCIAMPVLCGIVVSADEQNAGRALSGPYSAAVRIDDQLAAAATNGAKYDQYKLTPSTCPDVYKNAGLCGDGVTSDAAKADVGTGAAPSATALQALDTQTQDYEDGLAASTGHFALFVGILAVLAALGAALAALGLYERIAEYTFRG